MALRNGNLFALQRLNFEPLLLFYATAVTLNRMLQYRLYSTKFCTLPSLLTGSNTATNIFHGNNCWHLFDNFNGTMQRLNHELNVERLYLIQNMSLFPVLLIISSVTAFLADISPFISYEILLVALIIKIVHAFGLLVVSVDQVARVINLNVTSWSLALFENLSGGNVLIYALIFAAICENTRKLDRHFFVCRAFLLHAFGLFVGELLAALLDYVARNSRSNFFLWYGLSYLLAVSVVFMYTFKVSKLIFPETVIGERVLNDTIAAPEGTSYVQFSGEQHRYSRGNVDDRAHGKWPVCLNVLIFAILLVTFVIVNDDFGFLNESSYTAYHVSLFFDNWTVVQYPIIRIVQTGFRVIGLLITCLYFTQRRNSFTNGTMVALFAIVLQFVHYSLFYKLNEKVFIWNNVILSVFFDMFHFVPSVVFMSVFSNEYALNNNKLFCLIFIIERLFHMSWRYVIFGASYHDLVTLQTSNAFILKSLGILSVLLLLTPLVIFYYCRETHNLYAARLIRFRHCNGQVRFELKPGKDQRGQEQQHAREKQHVREERPVQLVQEGQVDRQMDRGDEQLQQKNNTTDGDSDGHGGRTVHEFDHVYRTRGPLRKTFDRFKRSRVAFRKRDSGCIGRVSAMYDKPGDSSGFVRPPPVPSSSAHRNLRLLSIKGTNGDDVNRGPPSVVPTSTMNRVHNRHDRCDQHTLQQVYMCTEV